MLIRSLTQFNIHLLIKTSIIASFYFLVGCATAPQTKQLLANPPVSLASAANISNVPFYSQQDYYCGPTTLAEVFQYNGIVQSPDEIAPQLFIPERKGSLQLEMIAATRQQGLLAYTERGNLEKLLYLIENDVPVIVLQNLAINLYPMWHYSVVKGYDLATQEIIQHTGEFKNRAVDLSVFERTWQRANYWYLIALPSEHKLKALDPLTYVTSAQDLISVKQQVAGINHLKNATKLWPNYWLSYFLLGNYYLQNKNINNAIYWFEQGYQFATTQSLYLNNYAFALYKDKQLNKAKKIILQAQQLSPKNSDILTTKKEIFSAK